MAKIKLQPRIDYSNEPNILGDYSKGALHDVCSLIREDITSRFDNPRPPKLSVLHREPRRFEDLLERARIEVSKIRKKLDIPTFPFAQDLSDLVNGIGSSVYTIMIVDGLISGDDIKTQKVILPINLGTNPYQLFNKTHLTETIDTIVTDSLVQNYFKGKETEQQQEETEKRRVALLSKGYNKFELKSSRFFYISGDALINFKNSDESINLINLIPYISFVPGKILDEFGNLINPKLIEQSDISQIPVFLSYREKQSLEEKTLTRTSQKQKFGEKDKISDWIAHRICVKDYSTAKMIYEHLLSLPGTVVKDKEYIPALGRTGRSRIVSVPYHKNYYEDPKENGYKSIKLRVIVQTGTEKVLREIQILDSSEYRHNELSHDSPQSRATYEDKKKEFEQDIRPEVRETLIKYGFQLNYVFDTRSTYMDLRKD